MSRILHLIITHKTEGWAGGVSKRRSMKMFNEASIGLRPRMFNFELEDNFSSETPAFLSQTRFFWMLLLL